MHRLSVEIDRFPNGENPRPVRIPKEIMQRAPQNTKHVLPVTEVDCPEIEDSKYNQKYEGRKTDLDLTNHINDVPYIGLDPGSFVGRNQYQGDFLFGRSRLR